MTTLALPTTAADRKAIPIYSGFIKYFPRAIAAVAELSRVGNDQHNPGQPLHWDRSKSSDERDALMRHLLDEAAGTPTDTDGIHHATKVAWRAMAALEKLLENDKKDKQTAKHAILDMPGWYQGTGKVPDGVKYTDPIYVLFPDGRIGKGQVDEFDWAISGINADIIAWRHAD